VPYSLLCRAIEYELKSRLLKYIHVGGLDRKEVKNKYKHDPVKAYHALEPIDQILNVTEMKLLRQANDILNDDKGFEYVQVFDAASKYKRFPNIDDLKLLADKLVAHGEAFRVGD
jgi:hypothetical protein